MGGEEGRRGLGRLVRLPDVLWKESGFEIGEAVAIYIVFGKVER